jgi:nicotinamidase-related amidase
MSKKDNQALIIIDVQTGLFEKSTPIYQAEQLLINLNHLIRKARKAGVPVFFIQHANDKTLVKGSDAWQLHPELKPLENEDIIHKGHGNAFIETRLNQELANRNIKNLVLTGLVTHGCIRATCLGALDLGYKVVLVSDGHSSFRKDAPKLIKKWNQAISEKGAVLMKTQDVYFVG